MRTAKLFIHLTIFLLTLASKIYDKIFLINTVHFLVFFGLRASLPAPFILPEHFLADHPFLFAVISQNDHLFYGRIKSFK